MTSTTTIPPDDGVRQLTVAKPEDETLPHLAVGTDTYTILIGGEDTAGRYALIDMLIQPGSGPPPHRHHFEEMWLSRHRCGQCHPIPSACSSCGRWRVIGPQVSRTRASAALAEWKP